MSRDRFVYWNELKATKDELLMVLEDYVRGIGRVSWNNDNNRFYIHFQGYKSWPFARLMPDTARARADKEEFHLRWFEVFIHDKSIDVITRDQDEITNNIADGFARLCANHWEASLHE